MLALANTHPCQCLPLPMPTFVKASPLPSLILTIVCLHCHLHPHHHRHSVMHSLGVVQLTTANLPSLSDLLPISPSTLSELHLLI
jgi:hypothetical protein